MADFGIPHLTVGQADIVFARLQLGMRAGLEEFVPMRRVGVEDGVVGLVCALAPAIENAKDDGARNVTIGAGTVRHGPPYKAMRRIKKRARRRIFARVAGSWRPLAGDSTPAPRGFRPPGGRDPTPGFAHR